MALSEQEYQQLIVESLYALQKINDLVVSKSIKPIHIGSIVGDVAQISAEACNNLHKKLEVIDYVWTFECSDAEKFRRHLELVSKKVATWPKWKQDILGPVDKDIDINGRQR